MLHSFQAVDLRALPISIYSILLMGFSPQIMARQPERLHHGGTIETRALARRSIYDAESILAFGIIMPAVSALTVALRLYVRCFRKKNAGLDDVAITIATGLSIYGTVMFSSCVHHGFGRHVWEQSSGQAEYILKWVFISALESCICLFLVRLSIGIFILRMLQDARRKLRIGVWFAVALNLAVTAMTVFVLALWCRPIQGIWNRIHGDLSAKCMPLSVLNDVRRAFAAMSATTDILYAFLPIAVVWRLKMDFKTRRNISIIMLLTLVTCICAIGKVTVSETDLDFTYHAVQGAYWTLAEENLGIIVASLPAMRQFLIITQEDITTYRKKRSQPDLLNSGPAQSLNTQSPTGWDSNTSNDQLKRGSPETSHRTIDFYDRELDGIDV